MNRQRRSSRSLLAFAIWDKSNSRANRGKDHGDSMRIQQRAVAVLGVISALALLVYAADLSGKWKAEFETQIGVQKYTFEFKVDGEKLTGKAFYERMNQKGEVELQEGKINGDEIFFVENVKFEGNELRIEYKGKIAGDEMKLTRKVADFATEQIVVKRVKS